MKKQINIIVKGRVQGVHFRASTKKKADQLGLFGIVKNSVDGHVEIIAQGSKKTLLELVTWCNIGSTFSNVEEVYVQWSKVGKQYDSFEVVKDEKNFIKDQLSSYKNFFKSLVGRQGENSQSIETLPVHVVIIPDGNRRWAKEKGWKVWKGHEQGRKNSEVVLDALKEHGVKYVTLWGFSTENWKRSQEEVNQLMKIFEIYIDELAKKAHKEKIKCKHFGRKDRLPITLREKFTKLEKETANYNNFHIGIALDYGGRDEILRTCKKIAKNNQEFTEENFDNNLDTKGFPDPDLIIRTSGEQRLSGIMPWQGVYAEIAISEKYFPEFDKADVKAVLLDYSNRKRRYGK